MAERFDPYHVWLGIPPREQPPNFYRLLSIPPFSSDPDVIESAADRQMAHLRTFQIGRHSDLSQKLLNEVAAAARVCLFNEEQKAAYDQRLRQEMLPPEATPTVLVTPEPEPSPESSSETHRELNDFSAIDVSRGSSSLRKHGRKRKRSSAKHTVVFIAGIIVFGVMGLSAGCFVLYLIYPQHPLIKKMVGFVHDTDKPKQSSKAPSSPNIPQKQKNRRQSPQPSRQPVEPVPLPPPPRKEPLRKGPPFIKPPQEETVNVQQPRMQPSDTKPNKLAVPTEEAQRRITAQLMQIHELEKRRVSVEKIKLAGELFNIGKNSTNPNEKYVLLDKAAQLAAEGGAAPQALSIVDMLGATFEFDTLKQKAQALNKCAVAVKTSVGIEALMRNADGVIDAALADERYDLAAELANRVY